jgi:hypothetical protein
MSRSVDTNGAPYDTKIVVSSLVIPVQAVSWANLPTGRIGLNSGVVCCDRHRC